MKAPGESSGEKDERKGAETADKVRAFRAPRPKRARGEFGLRTQSFFCTRRNRAKLGHADAFPAGPIKSTLDQLIDNVKANQGSSTYVFVSFCFVLDANSPWLFGGADPALHFPGGL